jgi:probable rRNA maturation factor
VRETVSRAADIKTGEVTVTVSDDEHLRMLNRTYRNKDEVTDVLSFACDPPESRCEAMPLPPGLPKQLGDVVLSYPKACEQAGRLSHSVEDELVWLTVHGVLQLLGYRHKTESDITQMTEKERTVLEAIGVTDVDVTFDRLHH